MADSLLILWHFVRTRWLPSLPVEWKLSRYLRRVGRECPQYLGIGPELEKFPLMSKQQFLAHFAELNRHGISLEEATETALRAERDRDFKPQLRGNVTVGLSSGTSGARHVFLVGRADRCRWAGEILARMLPTKLLLQALNPFRPPVRIAFFLRASSNLYSTLGSRRVKFEYYDLTRPFSDLMAELRSQQPQILVAPATVLAAIARQFIKDRSQLPLRQVISVAEVLDSRDRKVIEEAFKLPVAQVYQAAEGLLGFTCRLGRLHLNEESVHIERHWVGEGQQRFQPVVTDFSRQTQWFVRYQLTDVLRPSLEGCPCGSLTTSIDSIEGRAEEILWCRDASGVPQPVFPDSLRQALYRIEPALDLYRIEQQGDVWNIRLRQSDSAMEDATRQSLSELITGLRLTPPTFQFLPWTDQPLDEKQKRLRCLAPPT